MNRRDFIRNSAIGAATLTLGPAVWRTALAAPALPGASPYGALGEPDANGIRLPAGFRSRVVATSGLPVGTTGYVWHPAPDGGATFATDDGGWVYVSNSEVPVIGGAGALVFAPTIVGAGSTIVGAHRILTGTSMNCGGGPTPWGTWMSGEEHDMGLVWECDPQQLGQGVARPALGTFKHEAAIVDPLRHHVYLTEDQTNGGFYRFTPTTSGDLTVGLLEIATLETPTGGRVTWTVVPNPNPTPATPTRTQVPTSTPFNGGEGIFHHGDTVWFTTKGDNRVWALDCATQTIEIAYDDTMVDAPLRGVDNVTISSTGDVLVAEDGGDMQICMLSLDDNGTTRTVAPILQIVGQDESEITGPAFDPSGTRLYFSSQRGGAPAGPGITYEVTGPFRR